jgi:hypothetical protein
VVFIIAKTPDSALAMLAKKLDALVASQAEKKFAAVVNFAGDPDDDEFCDKIEAFSKKLKLKKVPLAITADAELFDVDDDAEVTVMTYRGRKVRYNYALAKGELNTKKIATIIADAKKMLAEPVETPKPPAKGKGKDKAASADKSGEKPVEEPAEDAKAKPAAERKEKPAGKAGDASAEKPQDQPANQSAKKPADKPAAKPANKPAK